MKYRLKIKTKKTPTCCNLKRRNMKMSLKQTTTKKCGNMNNYFGDYFEHF